MRVNITVGIPTLSINGDQQVTTGGIRVHYSKHYPKGLLVFDTFAGSLVNMDASKIEMDFYNGLVDTYEDSEVLYIRDIYLKDQAALRRHIIKLGDRR